MTRPLLLVVALMGCPKSPPPAPEPPAPVEPDAGVPDPQAAALGYFTGVLQAGPSRLRLALHVMPDGEGLRANLFSLDQTDQPIPASRVQIIGDRLVADFLAIGASFDAKIGQDTLQGAFTQGIPFPLTLTRGEAPAGPARPQTPADPPPYPVEAVTIAVGDHILAGTLTLPEGDGPFPGVVLITGSGPQDRDESLMGHKPFWVLADHLTRNGIAVLRYDDRGVAESTGTFDGATSADFAVDAAAVADALRARPEVNQVGLIGHSEGGIVGPLASQSTEVDFMVLLAPPTIPFGELLVAQATRLAIAEGMPRKAAMEAEVTRTRLFKVATDPSTSVDDVLEVMLDLPDALQMSPNMLQQSAAQLKEPWFQWLLTHDPKPIHTAYAGPTLALWGEYDLQVPAELNEPVWTEWNSGNATHKGVVMPELNHLLQPALTGAVSEYAEIETTIDPAALSTVTDWILQTTTPAPQ